MNTDAPELTPARGARLQDVIAGQSGILAGWKRVAVGGVKYLIGAFLCAGMFRMLGPLSIIGAVIVVGWTYRLMQRTALKIWWKRSPDWYDGVRFETLTATHDELRKHRYWPNWFRGVWFMGSLGWNLRIGFAAVFNSFVLTILPGLVWYLTWQSGWNNSFHFGYEQAFDATGRFMLGMVIFSLVMFYVPMAQARQAVTGDWKAFFHVRDVFRVIGRSWPANFLLAALYGILTLPVTILTAAPYFFGQNDEKYLDMSATDLLRQLMGYQFWASLFYIFPAFVLLHLIAAHIYARSARRAIQKGKMKPYGFEKVAVEKLHIDVPDKRGEYSQQTRFIIWTYSFAGGLTAAFFAFLMWMAFSMQIVVGQFFKYEANLMRGWVNQPLIQMPWFDLTPKQLLKEKNEELKAKAAKAKEEREKRKEEQP